MHVLVMSNFDDGSIKNEYIRSKIFIFDRIIIKASTATPFSDYKSMGKFLELKRC